MFTLNDFREFTYERHDVGVNQLYDEGGLNLPYSFHIKGVEAQAEKFIYLLKPEEVDPAMKGAVGHDLREDARLTYNDIKAMVGIRVAEIIFLCSDMRGRNRKERHPVEFYEQMNAEDLAVYVKHCDMIANVLFGLFNNGTMIDMYMKEFPMFKANCYKPRFDDMFKYTEMLFDLRKFTRR